MAMGHRPVRGGKVADDTAIDHLHRHRFDAVRMLDLDPETAAGISIGRDLAQRQALTGQIHEQAGPYPLDGVANLEQLNALACDFIERFHDILSTPAPPTMAG